MGGRHGRQSVYRYENAKDCPDCGANDVGDDDIKNFKYALGNLRYCMENFDKWISDEDDPEYLYRNGIYNYLYRRYKQLLTQVAITAYGVKTYERKANDPVPSYEFTPYAEQKEALDILYANRYMPDWVQRPELVRLMGIQRERIEEHKDYLSLLMNATATRLFIYEGRGRSISTMRATSATCSTNSSRRPTQGTEALRRGFLLPDELRQDDDGLVENRGPQRQVPERFGIGARGADRRRPEGLRFQ